MLNRSIVNNLQQFRKTIITRGTTSQRLGSISFSFFFFFHVAISDSVQWLPYLGFVPGPTRTTSKGLMSLLFPKNPQVSDKSAQVSKSHVLFLLKFYNLKMLRFCNMVCFSKLVLLRTWTQTLTVWKSAIKVHCFVWLIWKNWKIKALTTNWKYKIKKPAKAESEEIIVT